MAYNCNIIKDLMPSYIDNICSNETRTLVEEHIRTCTSCNLILDSMKQPVSTLKITKDEQIEFQKPFIKIKKKNRIKVIISAFTAAIITIICMMIIQNVGIIHDFFIPRERCIINLDSHELSWRNILFEDGKEYLNFNSIFYKKKITNDANSTESIELRISNEESEVIVDDLFISPGETADLHSLKNNTNYKVEFRCKSGIYILNFY